jgi:thioester reductase-like protein
VALLLMTGFPGFLGSALLPRLLARRPRTRAVCLVQPQHRETAEQRVRELERTDPHVAGRIHLVLGDITAPGLGVAPDDQELLDKVTEVWHLAAVYDPTVSSEVAHRVNVEGTARVLEFCRARTRFQRLQYVSTCYVSGRYKGVFTEDALDKGQEFQNHYVATKYEAEVLVRKAMADGLPATIYRPGMVVGDSRTGETQKYDGPYFVATLLRRQPLPLAVVPTNGAIDKVTVGVVPRDFVIEAMDELSVLDKSLDRTYALIDPEPPTIRELVDTFARRLGKRVMWLPMPLRLTRLVVDSVPGLERLIGLPAEVFDYYDPATTYSTTNTVADLAGTGLSCPRFEEYADTLIDFMTAHPEIDAKAMV